MSDATALIAVVDDDRSVCKALERLLRSAKFRVETYVSGREFLDSLQAKVPSCVVLDLHMPDVNGFEVQARLARERASVPVVVITGHDSPEARARVIAQGAKAYLCKPMDDLLLLEAIRRALTGEPAMSGTGKSNGQGP